jgi:lysozyme family protein
VDFQKAFNFILKWEGGSRITEHPRDPGGLTKYGISQRAYPDTDIKALTYRQAMLIYKNDYWHKVSADRLHPAIALAVFDSAVNQGVSAASKMLQHAVNAKRDGVIGPKTITAVSIRDPRAVLINFMARRVIRYTYAKAWKVFNLGWLRRTLDCAIEASLLLPNRKSNT